jgi:hypothetical protein
MALHCDCGALGNDVADGIFRRLPLNLGVSSLYDTLNGGA